MNIGIFKKTTTTKKEKKRREAINPPPKETIDFSCRKYNCEWINELHFMDEIKLEMIIIIFINFISS